MKLWVWALDLLNQHGKCMAIKLRGGIHPKHLVEVPERSWYLPLLTADDIVLDLGCGTGAHTEMAASRCLFAMGIDREKFVPHRSNVVAIAQDITRPLPFQDGTYNVVLFFDVIEHLTAPDRRAVLAEIHRVLKPDGRLMVSAPNRDTTWRRRLRAAGLFSYSDPDHKIEYTKGEFLTELAAAGFAPIQPVRPIVLDTPWAGLIDLIGGVSLPLYSRLSRWRHQMAHRYPDESIGFIVVAQAIR